ncbi:hypothetical protein CROQUDRAFT_32641, partial [Cronartium quercuum f. sp. fusiforme G11]
QYSILPAINLNELLAILCQEGSFLCEDFEDFLEFNLICILMCKYMNPFPYESSVLIIDNAWIHYGGRINELCKKDGI